MLFLCHRVKLHALVQVEHTNLQVWKISRSKSDVLFRLYQSNVVLRACDVLLGIALFVIHLIDRTFERDFHCHKPLMTRFLGY